MIRPAKHILVLQLTNRSSPTAAHQPQLTNRSEL